MMYETSRANKQAIFRMLINKYALSGYPGHIVVVISAFFGGGWGQTLVILFYHSLNVVTENVFGNKYVQIILSCFGFGKVVIRGFLVDQKVTNENLGLSKHPVQMSLKNTTYIPTYIKSNKLTLTFDDGEVHMLINKTQQLLLQFNVVSDGDLGCCFYAHTFTSSLLTSADKDQKGKYNVPILDVKTRQLVLDTNQTLLLNCR